MATKAQLAAAKPALVKLVKEVDATVQVGEAFTTQNPGGVVADSYVFLLTGSASRIAALKAKLPADVDGVKISYMLNQRFDTADFAQLDKVLEAAAPAKSPA